MSASGWGSVIKGLFILLLQPGPVLTIRSTPMHFSQSAAHNPGLLLMKCCCRGSAWSIHLHLHVPSPCVDKVCDHGAVCVVKNNDPVCECPEACPQMSDPVCGSDRQSYGSPCEMRAMSCALQKAIHIQHKGPCGE
ncbi:hypothetical protein WMY93_027957 [Mugilogobius chulae]|uniref:Kazal-like domain-containing protein n=1 Tax=Mugilogobius chulae TaxID=88201 RepID=A0AAW0N165_9GOBI